jgi:transposase
LQDNDPKHKSNLVQEWIRASGIDVLDWPPYSPDLNPIENLWADVKRRAEMDNPKTKEDLKTALRKSWSEIDARLIKELIKSMSKRCKLVREKQGWMTGY